MTDVPIWMEVAIDEIGLTEADFKRFFKVRRTRTIRTTYVKRTHSLAMGDDSATLAKASAPNSQSWGAAELVNAFVDSHICFCDDD